MEKKILMISEEDVFSNIYAKILRERGYDCVNTINMDNGRDLLNQKKYDLILIGLIFPESGVNPLETHWAYGKSIELVKYLRHKHDGLNKKAKIGLLTMSDLARSRRGKTYDLIKRDIDFYLRIPTPVPNLIEKINNCFS